MELTSQEREAVEMGDIVKFVVRDPRVLCVVVHEDLLDHLRLRAEFSPCDPDDLAWLTAETLDEFPSNG
jgi:hypothetical protein